MLCYCCRFWGLSPGHDAELSFIGRLLALLRIKSFEFGETDHITAAPVKLLQTVLLLALLCRFSLQAGQMLQRHGLLLPLWIAVYSAGMRLIATRSSTA